MIPFGLNLQRLAALLVVGVAISACTSILGIDAERDPVGDYPAGGYEGCQDDDCEGCITEDHREDCIAIQRGGGGGTTPDGGSTTPGDGGPGLGPDCQDVLAGEDCGACVCEHCLSNLEDCDETDGCNAIVNCILDRQCSATSTGSDGCYRADTCRAAIDDNGGLFGSAHTAAISLFGCATAEGCGCGQGDPSPECDEASATCDGCTSPCEKCLCEVGTGDLRCRLFCEDAQCNPQVNECGTCATECSQCLCENAGDPGQCAVLCGVDVPCDSDLDCIGCDTPLGQCSCITDGFGECLENNTELDCEEPLDAYEECVCSGEESGCVEQATAGSCSEIFAGDDALICACDHCPIPQLECSLSPYCYLGLLPCLVDPAVDGCAEAFDAALEAGELELGFAEALRQCAYDNGCDPPPADVLPHGEICSPNDPNSLICAGVFLPDGSVSPSCCTAGGSDCGVDVSRFPAGVTACQPTAQPGIRDPFCESVFPDFPPYYGVRELPGCCRPDGTCGILDDVLQMGCVEPGIFGAPSGIRCPPFIMSGVFTINGEHLCHNDDHAEGSPELSWVGTPRNAQSLVVTLRNNTTGSVDWMVCNLPPETMGLPAFLSESNAPPNTVVSGPWRPVDADSTDQYSYQVWALDQDTFPGCASPTSSYPALLNQAIDVAELIVYGARNDVCLAL